MSDEDNYNTGVDMLKSEFQKRGVLPPFPKDYQPPQYYNYRKPVRMVGDGSVADAFRQYGQG